MKIQIASFVLPIVFLGSLHCKASDVTNGFANLGNATTIAPAVIMACSGDGAFGSKCNFSSGISAVSATTTAAILRKEMQAVQPDALNYIAGSAPSPALYSIVEKLQKISAEELGQEISFEEAVNEIVNNI